jgi:hypothetical protein
MKKASLTVLGLFEENFDLCIRGKMRVGDVEKKDLKYKMSGFNGEV